MLEMIFTSGEFALVLIIESLLVLSEVNSHRNRSYNRGAYTLVYPGSEYGYNGYTMIMLSFTDAQRWCEDNFVGSKLLTVADLSIQLNVKAFIATESASANYIRVNGRFHSNGSWSWINGNEVKVSFEEEPESGQSLRNGAVRSYYNTLYAYPPTKIFPYICEYRTSSAKCDSRLNGKCIKVENTYNAKSWNEARNDCLQKDGDLASFDGLDNSEFKSSLRNLSLYYSTRTYYYWIGIQNGVWRWEDTATAVTYTDWSGDHPSNTDTNQCLCLNSNSYWSWKTCSCHSELPFICLINGTRSFQTTTTTTTSKATFDSSSSKPKTVTTVTSNPGVDIMITSSESSQPYRKTKGFDPLVMGVGISCSAVVIAIVIALIVIIRQRQKSSRITESAEEKTWDKNSNEIPLSTKTIDSTSKNFDAKTRSGPSETIYANVETTADSIQPDDAGPDGVYSNQPPSTIYVSVQPSLARSPDYDCVNSQANNIVYAELDLKPNTQREHK